MTPDDLEKLPAHSVPTRQEWRLAFDGQALKSERIKQGYTHESLATAVSRYRPGVSRQLIGQWERGQCPSAINLHALCQVLNKPTGFFIATRTAT